MKQLFEIARQNPTGSLALRFSMANATIGYDTYHNAAVKTPELYFDVRTGSHSMFDEIPDAGPPVENRGGVGKAFISQRFRCSTQ